MDKVLSMNDTVWLMLFLFTKHFIIDFLLQAKYQWSNKGTYGHPGGILHAGLHGIGTLVSIVWYAPNMAVQLASIDMLIHYHIDWLKMNLNDWFMWRADTHKEFWILLGIDQYLHALTYIGIIGWIG